MTPGTSPAGTLTTAGLGRATLARQLLLQRADVPVPDAVRRLGVLQAQEPVSPYLGLQARLRAFDAAALDAALAAGDVVRATLVRLTLHLAHHEDHRLLREAMEPTLRAARLGDARFAAGPLDAAAVDDLLPELLVWAGRHPRTAAEVAAWFGQRAGVELPAPAVQMLRGYLPLVHAVGGGPWGFARTTTFGAPRRAPRLHDAAVLRTSTVHLVRRYLAAFGPATAQDVRRHALVPAPRVAAALAALREELVELPGPGRGPWYDLLDAPRPPADVPAPSRLLPMWDSVLLAHADRTRVVDDDVRRHVVRTNGDTLPTVLVAGRVAGVWRVVDGPGGPVVEAHALRPVAAPAWSELEHEAAGVLAVLADREPVPYRRHHRWFAALPTVQVRTLGT